MKQSTLEQEQFQLLLSQHYQNSLKEDDPLHKMRVSGWNHFLELGLPTRQSEVFRSMRLTRLFGSAYQLPTKEASIDSTELILSSIRPECKKSHIVFVNGCYSPELSNTEGLPNSVVVSPLDQAVLTYGIFLDNQWTKAIKDEKDPFAAVNTALHHDGLFIYLPPKTIVEPPVQVLHLIQTRDKPLLITPRIHLFVGANAEIQLYTSVKEMGNSTYCLNQVSTMTIEENAHVKYHQNFLHEGANVWHFDALRVIQKRNSSFESVNVTDGCATMRSDYHISLMGENADTSLNGLCILKEKREAHTNVLISHEAPMCRSKQLFKGVHHDLSRSSFEGKIWVHREAQKTDAFQLNNNLLLSDRAHADSKPNLEVFADDVKASHGATVGQLDQEKIFYLRTRGLSKTEAEQFLIQAFCQEILNMLE